MSKDFFHPERRCWVPWYYFRPQKGTKIAIKREDDQTVHVVSVDDLLADPAFNVAGLWWRCWPYDEAETSGRVQ